MNRTPETTAQARRERILAVLRYISVCLELEGAGPIEVEDDQEEGPAE